MTVRRVPGWCSTPKWSSWASRPARRVADLQVAAVAPDRRTERRRRLAEPALDFAGFCRAKRLPTSGVRQLERAWDAFQTERHRRGEIEQHPNYTDNPYRPR